MSSKTWWVYMVFCSDGTYYTGVTTDVRRRVHEHNHTKKGAKYTRSRRPVRCVWRSEAGSRGEAQRREANIKKMSRTEKIIWLNTTLG